MGSLGGKLQEKTVTPTTERQEVVPDDEYYGLSKVTVEATEAGGGSASMFIAHTAGRLPEVARGTVTSAFTLDFKSTATGAITE